MYPQTPENEKMEFASEATPPNEQQSPPTYPSPQPNYYNLRIHPNHSHHHGPREYYNPYNNYFLGFSTDGKGFFPPPSPPPHFQHKPRPHDPFFFGEKPQKKNKKKILQRVLVGTAIICVSILIFNLGRGYELSHMRDSGFHHNDLGHPHRSPHMSHEFVMESSRGEHFGEKMFGHPGNFGNKHDEIFDIGFNHEFLGGKPHGALSHELGDHFGFRSLDNSGGPPPPFPKFGEPHDGKSHGKGSHKRPDGPKDKNHQPPKEADDFKKDTENGAKSASDFKILEGSE